MECWVLLNISTQNGLIENGIISQRQKTLNDKLSYNLCNWKSRLSYINVWNLCDVDSQSGRNASK
jgi:hypothetical protein